MHTFRIKEGDARLGRKLRVRAPLDYPPVVDDQLFQGALENLRGGEWLACRVREVSCFGEDGIDDDPEFCWRVYSCKVTVYRGGSAKA